MSPVEVRTLGQFFNLKRTQKKSVLFFGKCATISLQTNAGREQKLHSAKNSDKCRVEGWVTRVTQIRES